MAWWDGDVAEWMDSAEEEAELDELPLDELHGWWDADGDEDGEGEVWSGDDEGWNW